MILYVEIRFVDLVRFCNFCEFLAGGREFTACLQEAEDGQEQREGELGRKLQRKDTYSQIRVGGLRKS